MVARLAEQLAKRGHEVLVVDGEHEIIISLCQGSEIKSLVASVACPVSLNEWNIVAFASNIVDVYKWIVPLDGCRILFWSVHPFNSIYLPPRIGAWLASSSLRFLKFVNLALFRREHSARAAAVEWTLSRGALKFMDGENFRVVSAYYENVECADYIPIPAPDHVSSARLSKQVEDGAGVNLFWYGRICDFKVHGLVALVRGVSNYPGQVNLHVIGDGDHRWLFDKACKEYEVSCCFHGALPNARARELIADKADVVVAMGTAALEAAQLDIPTILAPASYKPLPEKYRFEWLYNSRNFDIGSFDTDTPSASGLDVAQIIDQIRLEKKHHAQLCRAHVEQFHAMSAVVDKLESALIRNEHLYDSAFIQVIRHSPSFIIRLFRALRDLVRK